MSKKMIKKTPFACRHRQLMIRGMRYRPEGKHLSIAIVCHGFMAFQDTVKQYANALAQCGYLTYTFDFCGGSVIRGKSEGKSELMSVLTEVDDLKGVLDFVKKDPAADPERITLMGCSQGGLVCALYASHHPEPIEQLILFYPALCIPDDARAGKMMWAKFDPAHIPEKLWCGPMKLGRRYVEDVIDLDVWKAIKGYHGDVLIVHGLKDRIVDPRYSLKAYQVYRQSDPDRQLELVWIEKGGHGFSFHADQEAIECLKSFVLKQNVME